MPEPANFQRAFVAALGGDRSALAPWCAPDTPAFAVYANTIAGGAVDALASTYPTVERITGRGWFAAAAGAYAAAQPPLHACLHLYGADFADWLAGFAPAADLPYLAPVARIDAAWSRAYFAADAPVLTVDTLAGVAEAALADTVLDLHPATTLLRFDADIVSLWHAQQGGDSGAFMLTGTPETALVTRCGTDIRVTPVNADVAAFCAACGDGAALSEAAALAAGGRTPLAEIITATFAAHAFSALSPLHKG